MATSSNPYDVAPDDERFIMGRVGAGGPNNPAYVLVQGFFEELRQRVPN